MLGRRIDQHVIVLAGHRKRDLALEIEVLLAADMEETLQAMRRLGDDRVGVTPDESVVGQHGIPGIQPLFDRDIGLLAVNINDGQGCGTPRDIARGRNDSEDRLTMKQNAPGGKGRLVGIGR